MHLQLVGWRDGKARCAFIICSLLIRWGKQPVDETYRGEANGHQFRKRMHANTLQEAKHTKICFPETTLKRVFPASRNFGLLLTTKGGVDINLERVPAAEAHMMAPETRLRALFPSPARLAFIFFSRHQ